MQFTVNGENYDADIENEMPLLWVLRDELKIKGPKYGCGIAQCGACTVHIDGLAIRSCSITAAQAAGRNIETIEGLGASETLRAVQAAWIDHQVAQCGYCQSGQIMSVVSFLSLYPDPTDEQIDQAMSANLCRCGTYPRIRKAIKTASATLRGE